MIHDPVQPDRIVSSLTAHRAVEQTRVQQKHLIGAGSHGDELQPEHLCLERKNNIENRDKIRSTLKEKFKFSP